jgi:hypothetical protein
LDPLDEAADRRATSTTMTGRVVDYERLTADLEAKSVAYAQAQPFPHAVFDDVLFHDVFARAVEEFPAIDDELWKGYLHVNETKYSNTQPDTWRPTLRGVADELCSPRFVQFLTDLTGIAGLIPDPGMDGGGLHQTLRGGHLNIHADFTAHHTNPTWARRVNILLYLNDEWRAEWGGQLELWERTMSRCEGKVTPAGNRMLVFTTSLDSFHGHPDGLTCPPDVARRSLALYYFTEEVEAVRRSTNYRARPGDGVRGVAIAADKWALSVYDRVKRRLNVSDEATQRVLARLHALRERWRR